MPGMETRGAGANGDEEGVVGVAEALADGAFEVGDALPELLLQLGGEVAVEGVEGGADVRGDGEAGGHGDAEVAHDGQAQAFAAQEVALAVVAVGAGGAEEVDELVGVRQLLGRRRAGGHERRVEGARRR